MWVQKRNRSQNLAQFVHCIKNFWTRRKGGEGGEGKGEDEDGAQSESASPVCPDLEARRLKWPLLLFGPSLPPFDCPNARFPSPCAHRHCPHAHCPWLLLPSLSICPSHCLCTFPITHYHCPLPMATSDGALPPYLLHLLITHCFHHAYCLVFWMLKSLGP